AIASEYPGGDVKALGDRLLSDMVAIFQALQERGELDRHADLLARSSQHAAALGEAMDGGDTDTIKTALTPVIEGFRLASSNL
nr:hypothetical protein [Candidatus Sigynarchaeota archaeon]